MKPLMRNALARLPLSAETVESFYDGTRAGTAEQCLKALCESHERLRAELEGAELLIKDAESEIARLRELIGDALALTDTGSPDFKEAFPPHGLGVPGWRVVEKIRALLLG